MIIEISIAVIAVAFVALVIYVIVMLQALSKILSQVNPLIKEMREQFEELGNQAKKTIEHTNYISFDLKRKMESLNSLFSTVSNIGDILEHKSEHLKEEALSHTHKISKLSDADLAAEHEFQVHDTINVADVLELAGIGIRLWQKVKKKNKYSHVAKTKEKEINQ